MFDDYYSYGYKWLKIPLPNLFICPFLAFRLLYVLFFRVSYVSLYCSPPLLLLELINVMVGCEGGLFSVMLYLSL